MRLTEDIYNHNNRVATETKQEVWDNIYNTITLNRRKRAIRRAITIVSSAAAIAIVALLLPSGLEQFDANPLKLDSPHYSYENLRYTTLYTDKDTITVKELISEIELNQNGELKLQDGTIRTISGKTIRVEVPEQYRTTITLSDGSKAHINSKSSVSFPIEFCKERRDMALSGEGFFDVAKDPNRKFVVHTKKFNVNVHGTKFNIDARNHKERSNIVLVEGSVSLESEGKRIDMERNTMVEFIESGYQIRKVDTERYYAWIDNIKIVDNEPLYKVTEWLSNHYNINVTVDRESKDQLLRGKLEIKSNPYRVIEIIAEITNLEVINQTDNIVLTTKKY